LDQPFSLAAPALDRCSLALSDVRPISTPNYTKRETSVPLPYLNTVIPVYLPTGIAPINRKPWRTGCRPRGTVTILAIASQPSPAQQSFLARHSQTSRRQPGTNFQLPSNQRMARQRYIAPLRRASYLCVWVRPDQVPALLRAKCSRRGVTFCAAGHPCSLSRSPASAP